MTGTEFAELALSDLQIADKEIVAGLIAYAFESGKVSGKSEYARELLAKGAETRKGA